MGRAIRDGLYCNGILGSRVSNLVNCLIGVLEHIPLNPPSKGDFIFCKN
tara:strand:+ start:330 stop:476 length:147 start_codon:yes stop_codon:yes gene_type:complete